MTTKKVILTGASLSSANNGINALTLGSIIALLKNNPNIHIEILNQNSHYDEVVKHKIKIKDEIVEINENFVWSSKFILCGLLHLLFSFLPIKLMKFLFIDNLKIFLYLFIKLKSEWRNKKIFTDNPAINKLISADYVINLAEGDSFSDIYGMHVYLRQVLDKILALSYKRKVIIFPQTIGPFNSTIARLITKKIIKNSHRLYVRENQSKNYLIQMFGELPNMEEANDMAFLMEPEEVKNKIFDKFLSNGIVVGINISGFLYNHPTGRDKIIGKDVNYALITEKIIETLLNIEKQNKIVFISHVSSEDFPVCKLLNEKYSKMGFKDRLFLLNSDYTAPQLKYFISRLQFFTGARMHACIGAFSMGVPTAPQAYSYKFKGITDKLNLGEYVIDLKADPLEDILNKILNAYQNRDKIRNQLLNILPDIKKESLKCAKL